MSLSPPFTEETAQAKVKKAQDLWNAQYKTPFCLAALLCSMADRQQRT